MRPDSPAELCHRTHVVGLLARVFLALLGCSLVSILFAARGRKKRIDKIYRCAVHARGDLYRLDSGLSASHRRDARRAGAAELSAAPRRNGGNTRCRSMTMDAEPADRSGNGAA